MATYILRRAVGVLVVMFAVVTGMFLLLHASPVSPVNQLAPQVAADPRPAPPSNTAWAWTAPWSCSTSTTSAAC